MALNFPGKPVPKLSHRGSFERAFAGLAAVLLGPDVPLNQILASLRGGGAG